MLAHCCSMARGWLRKWWPLVSVAGLSAGVIELLYLLFHARNRDDLSTYGAFAMPVVLLVGGWLAWAWRKGSTSRPADAAVVEALDTFADRLGDAVQAQWKQAAEERGLTGVDPVQVTWGRPSQAIAGPATAATGSHRFDPLPGLPETRELELTAGNAGNLHALYGGLRSGRLVVAGPPGSGKTGAAVLLLLAALRHRGEVAAGQRAEVPVPVLFTAQDWNPRRESAVAWLAGKLQATYPLLAGPTGAATATALLACGRIAVILDGLDEISPELRPVALQALSQQATFRLVILSRTSEIAAAAASRGVLQGAAAIELNPVGSGSAADYLQRTQLDPPPPGWRELAHRLRADADTPLSQALNSPLTLTLVRDTYHGGDIRELLEFADTALIGMAVDDAAAAIVDHLLDRVLPAAYAWHPGHPQPTYNCATAQQVLAAIAAQLNREGTRDLNWWVISDWAPPLPRFIAAGVISGVAAGLVAELAVGFVFGYVIPLILGALAFALSICIKFIVPRKERPSSIGKFRLRKALSGFKIRIGFAVGVMVGGSAGFPWGVKVALISALVSGLIFGLAGAVADSLEADPDSGSSLSPKTSWSNSRQYGLASGLVCGIILGLAAGFGTGLSVLLSPYDGYKFGLEFGLGTALAIGFFFGLLAFQVFTETWDASLASVQLAFKWGTQVRLTRFLDDALSRNVLRAVGPSYQFRHARLQDRLAEKAAARDK